MRTSKAIPNQTKILTGAILLAALLAVVALAKKGALWPTSAPALGAGPTSAPRKGLSTSSTSGAPESPGNGSYAIGGRVVDLDGQPVAGARVVTADGETTTGTDGSFSISTGRLPRWVTVERAGFLSRTRAAAPGTPVLVRLTPDDGETISIHFAGDTMFGRRFYDLNEDGNPDDGLLHPGDGASQHLALLADVQPLLQAADLTVLNLESALSANPIIDPTQPRPLYLHPTKQYVFLSSSSAAVALRQAGVDVVDLANNHVYDALEKGIGDTTAALEEAGFARGAGHFGLGFDEAQAWQPAVVTVRGQTIAFLGCTTITRPLEEGEPDQNAITYVASDAEGKGGAARCTEAAIRQAVGDAVRRYQTVVFMVHGGEEYERAPTEIVKRMTATAREAGARLVVNHQAHVTGDLDWNGSSLVAWNLGNFLFDQTMWPTFESCMLTVDLRRGQVVQAYLEPLVIEDFLPKGVTGRLAGSIARSSASAMPGPWVLENGALEVDVAGRERTSEATLPVEGAAGTGSLYQVDGDWWVSAFTGEGSLQVGRDLLWFGSFEDEDVDSQYQENAFWNLDPPDKLSGREYAYEGQAGVRLERGARDKEDVVLSPVHRILVDGGAELSVTGMVRASPSADVSVQLSWYQDTRGPSASKPVQPIAVESGGGWQKFRFDVTAPQNAVAVGLFVRLAPPAGGVVTADLDNVHLVEWSPVNSGFGLAYEFVRVKGKGTITFSRSVLPGGETDVAVPSLEALDR